MDYTCYKKEFIERFAEKGSEYLGKDRRARKDAEEIVNTLFDTIKEIMANGDNLTIAGFGTFKVIDYSERHAKCIGTNEAMTLPAYKAAKFYASDVLKKAVRDGVAR